jgi:hypothetical protein
MVIISLSEKIKQMALEQGFVAAGITHLEHLNDLPYGWVADIRNLKHPIDELPETKSVIMLLLHAWDRIFGLQIDSPMWKGYGFHSPDEKIEGYYISYMISMNKAQHQSHLKLQQSLVVLDSLGKIPCLLTLIMGLDLV